MLDIMKIFYFSSYYILIGSIHIISLQVVYILIIKKKIGPLNGSLIKPFKLQGIFVKTALSPSQMNKIKSNLLSIKTIIVVACLVKYLALKRCKHKQTECRTSWMPIKCLKRNTEIMPNLIWYRKNHRRLHRSGLEKLQTLRARRVDLKNRG